MGMILNLEIKIHTFVGKIQKQTLLRLHQLKIQKQSLLQLHQLMLMRILH